MSYRLNVVRNHDLISSTIWGHVESEVDRYLAEHGATHVQIVDGRGNLRFSRPRRKAWR